jgi:hypothetical protein
MTTQPPAWTEAANQKRLVRIIKLLANLVLSFIEFLLSDSFDKFRYVPGTCQSGSFTKPCGKSARHMT